MRLFEFSQRGAYAIRHGLARFFDFPVAFASVVGRGEFLRKKLHLRAYGSASAQIMTPLSFC